MKHHHLFVFGLFALFSSGIARGEDQPAPAGGNKPVKPHAAEGMPAMHDGKPGMQQGMPAMRDGKPGMQRGMPGVHDGKPGMQQGMQPGMHDGKRGPGDPDGKHGDHQGMPGMHEEGHEPDGPGRHRFKNAMLQLREDLKDGKLKKEDLRVKLSELHANVGERSKEHREDLGKRWGATLAAPPARDELKVHARRMAYLDRALLLVQSDTKPDKDKMTDRISKLIDKENTRHELAMARIQTLPAAAAASAGLAASAAAPAVPTAADATGGGK